MKLSSLVCGLSVERRGPDVEISGICDDSRLVRPGCLFAALPGPVSDGRNFIADAVKKGAAAVFCEKSAAAAAGGAACIVSENARTDFGFIASRWHGNPSRKLRLIGITGTNGKTTTSYLLESIFKAVGESTGVIGTVAYRYADMVIPAGTTTPGALFLHGMLAEMVRADVSACVMEVSSHALDQERVSGCEFDAAVFTQLTRDHLDYHKTIEEYRAAKLKLFTLLGMLHTKKFPKTAALNTDDSSFKYFKAACKGVDVVSYGLDLERGVHLSRVTVSMGGSEFDLHLGADKIHVKLRLLGKHNLYNALSAAACAAGQGFAPNHIKSGLEAVPNVPGRLEAVETGRKFTVLVDYAHTDDALFQALTTVRGLEPRRVIVVFGCGGDRDRTKRPRMGKIAVEMADTVFITSDNPRTEDPKKIIEEIIAGITPLGKSNYDVAADREKAIYKALHAAGPGDIVLIAGKGHEDYQVIGTKKIPFDDRRAAADVLRRMKG